jgi:hypothetical protein
MSDDTTTTTQPPPAQSTEPPTQSTQPPAAQTTQAPAAQTTQAPAAQTTQAPAAQTTQAPAAQTTQAPAAQTTQAPAAQTTQAPAAQTTQAPAAQTTQAPGTQSTSPNNAPPASSTTAAPPNQSTAAPATTTTAPPGSSTTAAPAGGAPGVTATIAIDPDDGAAQNPLSVQVAESAKLTLSWTGTNAASVRIAGLGDNLEASGSKPIETADATYTLVAVGADGSESQPFFISIATHPDGSVVAPHTELGSGIAAILSFCAMKGGAAVTSAAVGDTLTLTARCSAATDAVTIAGVSAGLAEGADGSKTATTDVTISAVSTGEFSCEVSAAGTVGDTGSVTVEIVPAPTASTTAAPAQSTTAAPAQTTTAPPTTTTVGAPPPDQTTTAAPGQTTTTPAQITTAATVAGTTTAAPAQTTTAAPASTTTKAEETKSIFSFPGEGKIKTSLTLVKDKDLGEYLKLEKVELKLEFTGTFESGEGAGVSIEPSWGDSLGVAIKDSGKFDLGLESWQGKWEGKAEAKASPPSVTISGKASANYKITEGQTVPLALEIEGAVIEMEKKDGEWEGKILAVTLTGSVSFELEIATESPKGNWKGSISLGIGAQVAPNWKNILEKEALETLESTLKKVGEEILTEAAGDLVAGIAEMALPFAVAAIIIYAFWEQSEDMRAQRELINGGTTNKAVDAFKEGFAAGLQQGAAPDAEDKVAGEGYRSGQKRWADSFNKFKATAAVSKWKKDVAQSDPDYGNDPEWVEGKLKDAFQSQLNPKIEEAAAAAGEKARPVIKHQLMLAWAKAHNNNTVDCLPVVVNLYPRRSDFTWAPGALPSDLADMGVKYGWFAADAVGKKAAAPAPQTPEEKHLGDSLQDHATAKSKVLEWAKRNVLAHSDSYRTMYPHRADTKLLTDEDLQEIDAQVHPGLPDGS